MKNRTPEESRKSISRLSEALLGKPDEIGEEEADQLLSQAGIDSDALNDRLYKRLYAEAQQFWMAKKDLPPLLKKALEDLRPMSAPPRNESELARQAKSNVERIVGKAKMLASSLVPESPLEFAQSYRNKQSLDDNDKKSLEAVQEELKRKIERLKRKDDEG